MGGVEEGHVHVPERTGGRRPLIVIDAARVVTEDETQPTGEKRKVVLRLGKIVKLSGATTTRSTTLTTPTYVQEYKAIAEVLHKYIDGCNGRPTAAS